MSNLCTLVVCGAPLAARAHDLVTAIAAAGWRVNVIATPAARQWLDAQLLAEAAGKPARQEQRSPDQPKSRERASALVVAPLTFNSLNKLAGGIADTLAHGALCEALGEGVPFLAVPMVNDYLAGHPVWNGSVERLTTAGVTWVSLHDGSVGEAQPVRSGTGDALVESFDPKWIVRQLPPR